MFGHVLGAYCSQDERSVVSFRDVFVFSSFRFRLYRRSPERFECYHRVIRPTQPHGNTHIHLGRSWGRTGYVARGHFCWV